MRRAVGRWARSRGAGCGGTFGTALLLLLVIGGLLLVRRGLLIVPARTTRLLNDAFVVIPASWVAIAR